MSYFYGVFYRFDSLRYRCLYIDFVKFLDKQVAVFRNHDGFDRCTEYFHAVFVKNTAEIQFCAAVEGGLATESEEDAEVRSDRQEINLIGHAF